MDFLNTESELQIFTKQNCNNFEFTLVVYLLHKQFFQNILSHS